MADLKTVEQTATCLFRKEEVEQGIKMMAKSMNDRLHGKNPVLLCVMNGGIVICGQLLTQLTCHLELDYIHVTRYAENRESQIHWLATPRIPLLNRHVILVDDILDGGVTLKEAKTFCEAQGATVVEVAVLLNKPSGRVPEGLQHADYIGLEVGPGYLYGYGLDYSGYLRNKDGIYAAAPEHI
jgi:hypoxanthine phosphoribosyltransferase